MEENKNKEANLKYLLVISAALVVFAGLFFVYQDQWKGVSFPLIEDNLPNLNQQKPEKVKKFSSAEEFREYIEKGRNISELSVGQGISGSLGMLEMQSNDASKVPQATSLAAVPERFSVTNIQVAGIDEPDIVKTDGKEIYFSSSRSELVPLRDMDQSSNSSIPSPIRDTGGTKAIKAFPLENLALDTKLDRNGDLLLIGNTLIIIPPERYYWSKDASMIYGYDVTDPKNPKEIWSIEMKESASIAAARLYDGKIYLAIKTDISDENNFCDMEPLVWDGKPWRMDCSEIYHPASVVPVDATYTAMILDPATGEIKKNVSFVGSSDYSSSVVYMSGNALYFTYYTPGDRLKILLTFFSENKNLIPDWLLEKLEKLETYDISASAKSTEIGNLIGRYQKSLSSDDRLKLNNEIGNRMSDFSIKHSRDFGSTNIIKMRSDDLSIRATGVVPGKLLNQFSLDEYNNNLRVAITAGENFFNWGLGAGNSAGTVSDVYILDDDLKMKGSVVGLGRGEKIYAVRFIGNNGYVVTFKQTDPFYVLDLSDSENPKEAGELKIPGYSSYLHPIAENRILGVGEEGGKVKVSLFDVADPSSPEEIAKYNLDEYWSGISETHHAFLQDAEHEIFFLPGSKGGYIFSYTEDGFNLEKTISQAGVERALYINDYLYVIGENGLVVLDEKNWNKVKEFDI
ncbi:MAG: beta-propeller domain-containing protein [Candidatus Moranbacteria bacterium]|nr:beta-propeller domain-containing protein [Candidatus Moranbacteria bacterium]